MTLKRQCVFSNVSARSWKLRKTVGCTTVTHFNVVHIDCHKSVIRLACGRDGCENTKTPCNDLLPLWAGRLGNCIRFMYDAS